MGLPIGEERLRAELLVMNALANPRTKPVVLWFAAFALAAIAMPLLVLFAQLDNRLIASLLVASPLVLMVKGAINAIHNAKISRSGNGMPNVRYVKRMLAITALYIASLAAALTLTSDGEPVTVLTVVLALLPGISVALYFWAIARLIVEIEDEFQKTLLVRQSLVATGLTMAAASIYGFLENFGVAPHVDAFWWPIVWFGGLAVGAVANKIAYGTTGEFA